MLTIAALKAETAVPVIIIDQNGTVVQINPIFERTWGWTSGELVGQSLTTIIPENLHDGHNMGFSRFALTGEPTILNNALPLEVSTAQGETVQAEHHIIAEKVDGHWVFGATIKPMVVSDPV